MKNGNDMARFFTIFFLLTLVFTPLAAKGNAMDKDKASAAGISEDTVQITELYKAMYRAMISKDMTEMAEIHDKSFVLIHMTGSKMNQKEYLEAVKNGTLNYYSAEHDDIKVTLNGDKAELRGRSRVNAAVYGGGKHTWRLQQDMKLAKINGKWLFTFSQAGTY